MGAIHEFGSKNPRLIYVALRWNSNTIDKKIERGMAARISVALKTLPRDRINVHPDDIRIYNLVGPEKDRGMELHSEELREAQRTIKSIVKKAKNSERLQAVIGGGKSGLMPVVALALKLLMPRRRVELRNHHKARKANAFPLAFVVAL